MNWGLDLAGDALRRRLSTRFERDRPSNKGGVLHGLSEVYGALATPVRSVELPLGTDVIGVAGATLGGSGVTPLVAELALALVREGRRVAVVAHGYRGRRTSVRTVVAGESPDEVGDDAADLASFLAPSGVPVVVGRPRTRALALAARGADVVLLDSVLQTRPEPLMASLLVLEAEAPWGAGRCPPEGNLRASPESLLGVASEVVWLEPTGGQPRASCLRVPAPSNAVHRVSSRLELSARGIPVDLESLAHLPFGLVTGVARAERIVRSLERRGAKPCRVVSLADHATARTFQRAERAARQARVELWLATSKCATKLGDSFAGAPLGVLRRRFDLPSGLVETLFRANERGPGRGACLSAGERAMVPPCSGTA